ncbi:MAG: group III truncated hemoglobin [Gammaproteobacteria bacterium]|jgi:hemoglobin
MTKKVLRPLCDKIGRERVDQVIRLFYEKLRRDSQLSPFFAHIRDFDTHERKIADFWWIAMGGRLEAPPQVDMVGLHAPMDIKAADLDRWLALFRDTLDEVLEPELADQWHTMALGIGARLRQTLQP